MRLRYPLPLILPPLTLGLALIVVLLVTACIEGEEPETTAPGPPGVEEEDEGVAGGGDVLTPQAGGGETPLVDPCAEAVPAVAAEVGIRQTVIGDVVNVRNVPDAGGETVLLEMGEEGGEVPLAVGITRRVRDRFVEDLEGLYVGQEVCVTGVVEEFQGNPVIFVNEESEIEVVER